MSNKSNNKDLHTIRQDESIARLEHLEATANNLKDARLPENAEIAHAIDQITNSESLREASSTMSPTGQKVMDDARKTMQAGKDVFIEKNRGEVLQQAVYHGAKAVGGVGGTMQGHLSGRDLASEHFAGTGEIASQAGRRLMNLGGLLVSSSEYRRLLNDLKNLAQDSFGAALSTTAPSTQHRTEGQYDQNGQYVEGSGVRDQYNDDNNIDVSQTAREHAPEVYQRAHETVQPVVGRYSRGEATAGEAARELGNKAADTARAATYQIKEQVMSPERREQLAQRLKALMIEFQSHPEFQSGLDELIDLAKEISTRATAATEVVAEAAADAADQNARDLKKARDATRQLIENFAGGRSLSPLANAIRDLGNDVAHDTELSEYFDLVVAFINRSIREPAFVNRDDYIPSAEELIRRGREVITDKHREHFDAITSEFSALYEAAANDQATRDFTANLQDLMHDLFFDDQGHPALKFDLMRDFARLVPVIAEKLEYLPVPRIEGSDDDVDYSLDNLVLRCTNLIPRHLHLHADTTVDMEPPVPYSDRVQSRREKAEFHVRNRVGVNLTSIRADARDIAFYFKKKTGVARLSDYGTLDMIIPDRGISLHIALSTNDRSDRVFAVERAEAEIHELKLNLRAEKHDILFKVLNPVITRTARRNIEKVVSEKLRALLEKINEQLMVMAKQAKESAKETAKDAATTVKNGGGLGSVKKTAASKKDPLIEQGERATDEVKGTMDVPGTHKVGGKEITTDDRNTRSRVDERDRKTKNAGFDKKQEGGMVFEE